MVGRCALIAGRWTLIGFALGALLAAAAPLASGARSYIVRSGSMTPAVRTGDIVVAQPIAPLRAHVGDIVTFRDPNGSGRLISHRVRAVHRSGGRVAFVTQGDANSAQERWTVPMSGRIGQVRFRIPKVGYALFWTATPVGRIGLTSVPAGLLGCFLLLRIWSSGRRRMGLRDLAS